MHDKSLWQRELEGFLEQAVKLVEKAEREGREEQRQGAEELKREVEEKLKREIEKLEREEREKKFRRTTLDEYSTACHDILFSKAPSREEPRLPYEKEIRVVRYPLNKWCPTNLRPWPDFLDQQRATFALLYDIFPAETRAFGEIILMEHRADYLFAGPDPIANEWSLRYFMSEGVHSHVLHIVNKLKDKEEIKKVFDLGKEITFSAGSHTLSEDSEEVVDRGIPPPPGQRKPRSRQVRFYRSLEEEEGGRHGSKNGTMIFISCYNASCNLTAACLRLGLRPMENLHAEVVNRKTIPTAAEDPEACFQRHADRLTLSAITEAYHYMIEDGLEYGLVTTGEMTVFLKVNWDEPETLLFHLADPNAEISAHPDRHRHMCTAVGQYLAFTLMALGSPGERRQRGQEERRQAAAKLSTWADDFRTTLHSIPEDERRAPEGSLGHRPIVYADFDRSPRLHRGRRQGTRRSQRILARQRPGGESTGQGTRRPYCTQKCLLGLVNGDDRDPNCPNATLHSRNASTRRHPISHAQFTDLLWAQLNRSLDDGIQPLPNYGARGVIFRVTLLAHGYTFVGKGTVRAFVDDLEHEAAVYERLRPVQGVHVPVFLGAIDLDLMDKTYHYDHRVYVTHLTFLSWGGISPCATGMAEETKKQLEEKAMQSLVAMHENRVCHMDVRRYNMLVNAEVDGILMIDFERSLMFDLPKRPRNEQEQTSGTQGTGNSADGLSREERRELKRAVRDDLLAVYGVLGR